MRRNRQNNQVSMWNDDPFEDMRRMQQMMMQRFSSNLFNDDDFFGGFGGFGNFGNLDRISRNFDGFGFDDMRNDNGNGQYVMQSYTTKTVIGPDGRPVTEKHVKKETSTMGRDGKRIVERDNIYKHTGQNIKKVEKERRLGDQRIKVTKEIKNNERNEYRDLENMEEHEVEQFNSKFNKYAQDSGHRRLNYVQQPPKNEREIERVHAIKY